MGCVPTSQRPTIFQRSHSNSSRNGSAKRFTGYYGDVPRGLSASIVNTSRVSIPYPDQVKPIINNNYRRVSNVTNSPNQYGLQNRVVLTPQLDNYGLRKSNIIQPISSVNQLRPSIVQPRASIASSRAIIDGSFLTPQRHMKRTSSFTTYGFPQILVPPPIQGDAFHPKAQAILDLQKKLSINANQIRDSSDNLYMSRASQVSSISSKQNRFGFGSQKQMNFVSVQLIDPEPITSHSPIPHVPIPISTYNNKLNDNFNNVVNQIISPRKVQSVGNQSFNKQNQYGFNMGNRKNEYYYHA